MVASSYKPKKEGLPAPALDTSQQEIGIFDENLARTLRMNIGKLVRAGGWRMASKP
jgi:hypothetical protein